TGLDTDFDGTPEVNLPAFGADPLHKDLFLELDFAAGQSPRRQDIQAMKAAFAAAPISAGTAASNAESPDGGPGASSPPNPDGQRGINLHVDTGGLVDPSVREGQAPGTCMDGADNGGDGFPDGADSDCVFLDASVEDPAPGNCTDGFDNDSDGNADGLDTDCLVGDNLGGGNQVSPPGACELDSSFYDTKWANFSPNRSKVFRYAISAAQGAGCDPSGGQGEIGGNDFIEFNHDGGTIMHELGHTLNLHHGGRDDDNCKPNFVSVMSYDNQFGINRTGGGTILDYAPPRRALNGSTRGSGLLPTLVEDNLNEATVLDPGDPANRFVFVNAAGSKVQAALNQTPNWNGDTDPPTESGLQVNVDTVGTNNQPAACSNGSSGSILAGAEDWVFVSLPFRQFGDAAGAPISPETDPVPRLEDLQILRQELNRTDLSIGVTDSPEPAVAGAQFTYALTVTNAGPNPASSVQVVHTLPADVSFVSASATCGSAAGVVTCRPPEVLANATRTFTVTVSVPPDLVFNNGGPKTISATASVTNLAGPDPNAANNTDAESTTVIALADLSTTKACNPDPVIPGNDLNCSLTVSNAGPSVAASVVLTDDLSEDVTLTAAPPGGGFSCTIQSGEPELTCTKPRMNPAETATLPYTTSVSEDAAPGSTLANSASATSATTDPTPANNTAVENTAIPPCSITGTSGPDILTGTANNDVICGLGGPDVLSGRGGDDIIIGREGGDILNGDGGNDALLGNPGNDVLNGGDGNDTLRGGPGPDAVYGDSGNDDIFGGADNDALNGGAPTGPLGQGDRIDGGPGNDACVSPGTIQPAERGATNC
ncbi:MAG TPA: hypothetical protein VFV02_01595, partial [Acidimicrobiales bacterium]|nr:hypothetical protein [Acidimicrobiales bacterium]